MLSKNKPKPVTASRITEIERKWKDQTIDTPYCYSVTDNDIDDMFLFIKQLQSRLKECKNGKKTV